MTLTNDLFVRGYQCHKLLWTTLNTDSTHQDDIDYVKEHTKVEHQELLALTCDALARDFELDICSVYRHDGCEAQIDLIARNESGTFLYLIRPVGRPKRAHFFLLAYWKWVLQKNGIEVNDCFVVNLDNKYERKGKLDFEDLTHITSVRSDVHMAMHNIEGIVNTLQHVAKLPKCPTVDIGFHCTRPSECELTESCWQALPSPSVFDIFGLPKKTKFNLYRKGCRTFKEGYEAITPDPTQRKQAQAEFENKVFINKKSLSSFLSKIQYPIQFIDFEAVQFSIPRYQDTHPFEQIPFQFSMHYIEDESHVLEHVDFLASPGTDPRRKFAEALCETVFKTGTILAFNTHFEKHTISTLAEQFPDLAGTLMDIHSRVIDLAIPFNSMDYYIKEMQGKRSIKSLFHALVDDMPYYDLSIMNGEAASKVYCLLHTVNDPTQKAKIRADLRRYCHMDTLAMVRLWQNLQFAISN
jgi:hypothetical protein